MEYIDDTSSNRHICTLRARVAGREAVIYYKEKKISFAQSSEYFWTGGHYNDIG